jgi:hypothetical protein
VEDIELLGHAVGTDRVGIVDEVSRLLTDSSASRAVTTGANPHVDRREAEGSWKG